MHFQKFSLCVAAFLAGCHALPNSPEGPEAFNKVLEPRQVGGNCNFTGVCFNNAGNDIGECIGESAARCCHESSFCSLEGNACEFTPGNNNPAFCA